MSIQFDAFSIEVAAPGLRLSGVSVGWPGGPVVQQDLELSVAPGERVALTGASGIGKTTVAATAMGLIPPHSGVVERGGRVGAMVCWDGSDPLTHRDERYFEQ